jgi:hypothetical protein
VSGRVTRLGRTGRSASMAAPRTLAPIRAGGGTVHRLSPRRCGIPLAVLAGLRGDDFLAMPGLKWWQRA